MNKNLWGMSGALRLGTLVAVLLAALSTLAFIPETRSEELSRTSGMFLGIEPGKGRARSISYAVIASDGNSRRFAIDACEQQIAQLPKGTAVNALHDAHTLFEIEANGQLQCTYAATVQARTERRSSNLRWTLSGAAGGILLALLSIWSRGRTNRHLTQLRAAMQHRESSADR